MNRHPAQRPVELPAPEQPTRDLRVRDRRDRALLARTRLVAWLIDLSCIAGAVVVLAAVGAALYAAGALHGLDSGPANVLGFLVLIAPVTLAFSWFESGSRQATVGKRSRSLRVVDAGTGSQISLRQALVRNALKLALPWEIGHTVVYGLAGTAAGGAVPGRLIALTVLAYLLPALYVATLFVGSGRPPYDRIARTVLVRTS